MHHSVPLSGRDYLVPAVLQRYLDGGVPLIGGSVPWEQSGPWLALLEWLPGGTHALLLACMLTPGDLLTGLCVPPVVNRRQLRHLKRCERRWISEAMRGDAGRVQPEWRLLQPHEVRDFALGVIGGDLEAPPKHHTH